MEVTNKLIKQLISTLLRDLGEQPSHWTSTVTAAVAILNTYPKAAKGQWSSPALLAEGEVNPFDLLLDSHVGTDAANSLPILSNHAKFVEDARTKVLCLTHSDYLNLLTPTALLGLLSSYVCF